jgi:DoxX-like family
MYQSVEGKRSGSLIRVKEKNYMSVAQIVNSQLESDRRTTHRSRSAMNIALWILQALWGVFFCFTGFGKALCYRADVWNFTLHQPVAWFHAVPQGLFVFIGACEFLGGAGLILPAMTGIKPKLVALAAIGLTVIMVFAAVFHIVRGEVGFFVPMNLALAAGSAFIAYGRLIAVPVAERSISTFQMVTAAAVLAALVFVGYAPIAYQLTHTH